MTAVCFSLHSTRSFSVAWIHIDRQMILTIHRHVITRLARFSVSHDNAMTWLLHVSQVQQEDRGYYMCQVNTNPMISQVGYLQMVLLCPSMNSTILGIVQNGEMLDLTAVTRIESV
ncbi:Zwei Ig domain protein zig-8 [Eumeta japonica]|uniref:Zwei Ig domain protein zig-8 n=1 Tax=Eumeta variegata TaxID=151549 RepID=A0A4C1WNJ2_EUMVA|nr:Zwei Ig domain protein zig-8 [Eumeta japonica]